MFEINFIRRYKENENHHNERFSVNNIEDIRENLEKLRWKYKRKHITLTEFVEMQVLDKEDSFHIELWQKNQHNDIWVGMGDYFFLSDENIEQDIYKTIRENY